MYRPYIVGTRDSNRITAKRARLTQKRPQQVIEQQGMSFVLNKSLKNEIVRYAQNVSQGVNGVQSAARSLLHSMDGFSRNAMQYGREQAVSLVEDGVNNLVEAYNKNVEFMRDQNHSPQLRNFSYDMTDNIHQNQKRLNRLGISFTETEEGERMLFDRESFRNSTRGGNIYVAIGENIQMLDNLYRSANQVLTAPLSEHMQFKALNYHYNYQLGRMVEDGFGIIDSGLIVDKVV